MELQEKIMNVIYDSGYEPVIGNHKRGHVDLEKLVENLQVMFNVHYGDSAEVLSRVKESHVEEKGVIYKVAKGAAEEVARLKSRNWYQRLFNL